MTIRFYWSLETVILQITLWARGFCALGLWKGLSTMSTLVTASLQTNIRFAPALLAVVLLLVPKIADAEPASVRAVEGVPVLMLSGFDLGQLGYQKEEFFISGTATSYNLQGPATADGDWSAATADTSPYGFAVTNWLCGPSFL